MPILVDELDRLMTLSLSELATDSRDFERRKEVSQYAYLAIASAIEAIIGADNWNLTSPRREYENNLRAEQRSRLTAYLNPKQEEE